MKIQFLLKFIIVNQNHLTYKISSLGNSYEHFSLLIKNLGVKASHWDYVINYFKAIHCNSVANKFKCD